MRVCIISDTLVTQEPRVLRQIRTFRDRGWQISVAGYPGSLPVPADWDFHDLTLPPPVESVAAEPQAQTVVSAGFPKNLPDHFTQREPSNGLEKLGSFLFWRLLVPLRRALSTLGNRLRSRNAVEAASVVPDETAEVTAQNSLDAGALVAALLDLPVPRAITLDEARAIFYREPKHLYFRDVMAPRFPPADLIIAHDYHVLPLADDLAQSRGTPIVFDIHEYAVEQYPLSAGTPEHRYFGHVTRPMIDAFHRHYFGRIRAASCVCESIANQVAQDYALPKAPAVVRSTPFFTEQPFRPTGPMIDVMYHGLVNPTRHLEIGVRSLALWRPEFRFTIRGPGPESYIAHLKELARELGVEDRLAIKPPVPFHDLIPTANKADIGYLAFMNYSRQRQFASPNKFFEYIMAGLAMAVMDVPELAPVVTSHRNGAVISDFTPEDIARCINSFDAARIDACKKASLELAKELCWEREQARMIEAYGLAELESALASKE
ncbi:MAG: glycosyltransferase [Rhizobiales bacterium]|nr:glycosyltransferase [Hyphomicrobiales bacterium]